ncbi:4Fe-4S dicluster domain-containing protein [Desulfoscipio gibsoniae]|uniref:Dissimilatory sulfite reductase (Desulfoviridin), alpha/beta subunit n=1 Tax=Desulfoscipio gibsoniae DSM 7213 TaxID=767817 RepID=R4KR60_9FIRM|nr:4Fe-4S dicluster domain-containing protein [Desulfoscipio gibsoniae]AGL03045.1 dissimilatory sulfite reductase (desulfoviridin), alpha/beta subunit [Desulfoscipio gibsoniae DSM 7213]
MNLFTIKKCRNCPNRLVNLDKLENQLQQVMDSCQFNIRTGARINKERPLHHQMFHLALAGCPNSCSRPQIKDFGVQGQAVPEVGDGCSKCGACIDACAEAAISMAEEKAAIDRSVCLNCGQCARACPTKALQLNKVGYKVLAGGKLGRHPRLATELMAMATTEEVEVLLKRCVELFINEGRPGERFGSVLNRTDKDFN